jgi:hypothetical protein
LAPSTWFTSLEFNQEGVLILFNILTTSGLLIILFLTTRDKLKKRKLLLWAFLMIISTTIVLRVGSIFIFGSGFVTQELLYVHKGNKQRRIEFQMEDIGAFGYNRRLWKLNLVALYSVGLKN